MEGSKIKKEKISREREEIKKIERVGIERRR